MSSSPQKLREICLLALCARRICADQDDYLLHLLASELKLARSTIARGLLRANELTAHTDELDRQIDDACEGYQLDRIGSVERSALRLGCFEVVFDSEIPNKVAIAEAVRLVRKFSSRESGAFVNAVMDKIFRSSENDHP